jgi:lipid-A-disaccharide synthase-like uncharacterized protein
MNKILIDFLGVQITWWKLVGYSGVLLFSARWLVQMWASRAARKPTVPMAFWVMSVAGSLACLAYFIFGKNDSVGVLSNLFPCGVAAYNLSLELAHRRSLVSDQPGGAKGREPLSPEGNLT